MIVEKLYLGLEDLKQSKFGEKQQETNTKKEAKTARKDKKGVLLPLYRAHWGHQSLQDLNQMLDYRYEYTERDRRRRRKKKR